MLIMLYIVIYNTMLYTSYIHSLQFAWLHIFVYKMLCFDRVTTTTWLCFFDHDLLKCTHLQSNMRPDSFESDLD